MVEFRRFLVVGVVLLSCIGCDRVTKVSAKYYLAESSVSCWSGIFRLQYVENEGAFLSAGSSMTAGQRFWIFTMLTGLGLGGLLLFVATARKLQPLQVVAFSLIIGGGLGNLIDRIFNHGAVIDFVNLGIGNLRTGIFNAADVQILAGICLLLLQNLQSSRPSGNPAE